MSHTTVVANGKDVGTDKEEHYWSLFSCNPPNHDWKETMYNDEKTRDSWDSHSKYFKIRASSHLVQMKGYVPPCVCLKIKREAAVLAAFAQEKQQKRKTIRSSKTKKTFSKIKKIKFI